MLLAQLEERIYAGNLPKMQDRLLLTHHGPCLKKCQIVIKNRFTWRWIIELAYRGQVYDFPADVNVSGGGGERTFQGQCPKAGNQRNNGAWWESYCRFVTQHAMIREVQGERPEKDLRSLGIEGFIRPFNLHVGVSTVLLSKKKTVPCCFSNDRSSFMISSVRVRLWKPITDMTAFRTRYGHFDFTVIDLADESTARFLDLMNALQPLFGQIVLCVSLTTSYYSKSREDMNVHLKTILDYTQKEKLLPPNSRKVRILVTRCTVLGMWYNCD
ncbi:hypothetical protein Tco_0210336 [Tanacetum coccineum]